MTDEAELAGTGPGAAMPDGSARWRALCLLAADLAFETDLQGRLTFVAPGAVLGQESVALLGRPLAALLAGPDPALPGTGGTPPLRQHPAWMRRADGTVRCLALTTAPRLDEAGRALGARGVGVDVTERERRGAAAAAGLRRADLLERLLSRLRREAGASDAMGRMLGELMEAMGADGAAILDGAPRAGLVDGAQVLHAAGADPLPLVAAAAGLLIQAEDDRPACGVAEGCQVLACPAATRLGDRAALMLWRGPGGRPWDGVEQGMATAASEVVRIVLEHEAIQRELARQARTDPLTGLLNRRAFLEEAGRRLDRLDGENLPGTLVVMDLDRLQALNDRLGHEAGDAALVLTAELLRRTFRPTDLVARVGGDAFALWLDGSDELTAAERAERLRTGLPAELAHLAAGEPGGITLSIGIASRSGSGAEELETLMQRADAAVQEVKRAGGGQWRVSQVDRGG